MPGVPGSDKNAQHRRDGGKCNWGFGILLSVNGKHFKQLLHWFVNIMGATSRQHGLKFAGPDALGQRVSNILQRQDPLLKWLLKREFTV